MREETQRGYRRPGRKGYLLLAGFALLLVLLPFLFWYDTWFGRRLTDAQIDQYFADHAIPRHAQHALVQIGERLSRHQDVSRWYPQILEQSRSPVLELRQTAAWIMGQERSYPPFHSALLNLLQDPEPMVRRNAALALAAYGDSAARPELVQMLRPFTITASAAGTLRYRLKPGDYVNPGTLVAHIGASEVRSAVPGEVRELARADGSRIERGDPIADLAPDKNHVWEALRGLYLVGQPADLEDVSRYLRPAPGMPESIARQALATEEAIRARRPPF
jgi:biotin carboxyl carrier protein